MSHLNHDVLDTLREALGESDFFEVTNTFAQQFEHQLQAFIQHAQCRELPECARLLHSLKGSAGNIGAQTLAEIAHTFEQQLRQENVSLERMIEALSNTTNASIDELRDSGYLGANP
ncbi:MAG: Hpt domain-containing protein [Chromatiales bacterium]|nr:Hpt domain-containing protein [Chromatiales bacterium]